MINKETIISAYDEKLTLVQWLKLVNKALDEAVLTNVEIAQRGNATFVFVFTFEDGTQVESNEIIVNQGESVNGASIRNGHLYLTLTNGDELDAGNVKPVSSFSIDASQHLIVNYGDGTSQDLGAIFQGDVNIDGNFTANSIIQKMSGFAFNSYGNNFEPIYAGACQNGNKLTLVVFGKYTKVEGTAYETIASFNVPSAVFSKLYPYQLGSLQNALESKKLSASLDTSRTDKVDVTLEITKNSWTPEVDITLLSLTNLTNGSSYFLRIEQTFLLSDNMAV